MKEKSKKTVTWAEGTVFKEREAVVRVERSNFQKVEVAIKKGRIVKATKILQKLSSPEAFEVIHQDDGQIITYIVHAAYHKMEHKEKFENLYKILIALDKDYTLQKVKKICSQMIIGSSKIGIIPYGVIDIYKSVKKISVALEIKDDTDCAKTVTLAEETESKEGEAVVRVEKSNFQKVEAAIGRGEIATVTEILQKLSSEEVLDIIYQNGGQVIKDTIKIAYSKIRSDEYNKKEVQDFFRICIGLCKKYTDSKILEVHKEIIAKSSIKINAELGRIYRDISEISKVEDHSEASDKLDTVSDTKEEAIAEDHTMSNSEAKQADNIAINASNKLLTDLEENDIQVSISPVVEQKERNNTDINKVSSYIFNQLLSWFNELPGSIREYIEQASVFQMMLEIYKELQAKLTTNDVKVVIESIKEVIDNTKFFKWNDDLRAPILEKTAHMKLDQDDLYHDIDKTNILDPSLLEFLPLTMVSGLDSCMLLESN